jgi:uncharacterized OB-fold protein
VEPIVDEDSRAYWEGLRAHRLVVQRCSACGHTRFPPMPSCPSCGAPGAEDIDAGGAGAVYSFVRVHRAFSGDHAADVPYTVAVVDLDEGCRVLGRIDDHGTAAIGDRVTAVYADHAAWTELRFRVRR